jgi:hypothetical protein
MKIRSFEHEFRDGHIASFTLGPRRELTLEIALNPVWNKHARLASVRFGGVQNYNEVASFFRALPVPPAPHAYVAESIGIKYVGNGRDEILVDHGHVKIHSHHVTEL